ncbi:MAG: IMP cyclohydrolase [Chloroflexota bacterium]
MTNPSGPYPGRQLFLGLTADRKPCFAYLVTGRSPESRERKAIAIENTVRIGPLGNIPYDPLRHYTAIKYDNSTGIAAVSNGIQTEAIYETYKLLFNVGTQATKDSIANLLDGANAEPDSLHTPRIAGAIIVNKGNPAFIIGIKTYNSPAAAYQVAPAAGSITGVATYQGSMDSPQPTNPGTALSKLKFDGNSPHDLAQYLYDISAATCKGEDIRVCSVGGIYSGNSWDIAIINKY